VSDALPRLRQVEVFPVEHEGRRYIALRDQAGYTGAVLMLPTALLELVSLLDGEHSVVDIQAALMRRHGELVARERIEGLVQSLDEHGFMDTPGFAARREAADRAFRESSTRPASHAGAAYAAEPEALRRAVDGFFTPPEGPGPIGGTATGRPVRGLIAPHIDFHRGGPAYAWAYRDLAERGDADVFVVFGTCHAGMADPFALTRKPFETPLGPLPVERDFVEALAARAGQDCFASELAHRNEHSIEFQAVFLRYLYAGRREVTVVPILASFVHEALYVGRAPEDDARVPRFLEALATTVSSCGRRVAFIAGADLAHVGPRFGDPEPVSQVERGRIEAEDRAMLAAVETGDAAAFFESARRDGDRRRVCGLSPIYALLRATGGAPGTLRRYGQWPDPTGVVSFASVVF
jgi:AmmeMemoRadiSam system protein B